MMKSILGIPLGFLALGVLVHALAAQQSTESQRRTAIRWPIATDDSSKYEGRQLPLPPSFAETPAVQAPTLVRPAAFVEEPPQPLQLPVQQPSRMPAEIATATLGAPVVSEPIFDNRDVQSGFSAGGAFYYLKPYLQNNTALVTTINPGQPNSQVSNESFHWDFKPTFAGWIGWSSACGLGIRSRYFQFDQNSNITSMSNGATPAPQTQTTVNAPLGNFLPLSTGGTAFGSPGTVLNTGFGVDQVTVSSDLRIHTIDLEATYAWRVSRFSLLAFGGGRYLDLQQDYRASLVNTGGGSGIAESQLFTSSRRFTGGGPTLGFEGNVQVGRGGLSLFASGRGSVLVGSMSESVALSQTVNDPRGLIPGHVPPPAILQINPTATRNTDHTISGADIELGFQYGRMLGRTWVFVRGAAVSQTYFDAGNASQSTGNLSLFGIQTSLGINY